MLKEDIVFLNLKTRINPRMNGRERLNPMFRLQFCFNKFRLKELFPKIF